MKKARLISRIIAAVLAVCVIFSNQGMSLMANAAQNDQELKEEYVKEVKMFYAVDEKDAQRQAEAEGFTISKQNLMEGQLNDLQAYLGYKTTKDKGDAITDMTLLDMKNSHYEEMTYEEFLDDHIGDFADQAAQIMIMVNEFRKQYKAGSPNALMAYDSLNFFYVDEKKNHNDTANLMGTYILEKADIAFFEKYIQRGNAQIAAALTNHLGLASSDYEKDGSTWADRAQKSDILEKYAEADSAEKNQYDTWYQDPAARLAYEIETFTDTYSTAKKLYDKYGDTFGYEKEGIDEDTSVDEMVETDPNCKIPEYMNAMVMYDMLAEVSYGKDGGTLADYFIELGSDGNLGDHPESLYPLVASMTSAQLATLDTCGLSVLVKGLHQYDDFEKERKDFNSEARKKLEDLGYEDGKIYLWENVDQGLWTKKAAETSDAIEMQRAGTELINSQNEAARKAASTLTIALQITDIVLMAASGIFMIVQAIVGVSLWTVGMAAFSMCGAAMAIGVTSYAIGYALLGTLCCACYVLAIIVLIASIAYMIYTILDWCGVFDEDESTDYTNIPEILFHGRKNQDGNYYVRYDAVKSNYTWENLIEITARSLSGGDEKKYEEYKKQMTEPGFSITGMSLAWFWVDKYGKADLTPHADVGAFMGTEDRWVTLYTSKAPACGDPIKVASDGSIIRTKANDYQAPAGCKPVSLIGGSQAADINSIQINEETGTPLYMFVIKDPDAKEEEKKEESSETKKSDQFITRVRLVSGSNRTDCINSLKKSNFMDYIDVNLTPYGDKYTYLGYQMGSRSGALTDLRVSNTGTDPIVYGSASYGRQGLIESGITPDAMSLYATTDPAAGTPITKISVETKRLPLGSGAEPVCLFAGGNAVDFKHKWSDNVWFSVEEYRPKLTRKEFSVKQDDPENGLYIYFWPETQYKATDSESKAPYVGGFSYFMAASDDKDDNRYGSHREFMQKFASANGFELINDGNSPAEMMSTKAATMNPIANWQDCEGGALGHDWRYDIFHFMVYNTVVNYSDGAMDDADTLKDLCLRGKGDQKTAMYFGVSYTYNPYRAITGISGLLAPYTETSHCLRYSGLTTPSGTMQVSNTSIQGNPVTQPGICYGYYSYTTMAQSMYVHRDAKQKYDIPWLSGGETEVLSHYLLTNGPKEGLKPIRRDDLKFVQQENPGQISGYVPLCDMRTPGDYEHPMNLALDTTNIGSKYLYLYMKNNAGGRTSGTSTNAYEKKHYVAGVFCGTGKTPEEAIANLYSRATGAWAGLAARFPDISDKPLVTEFDEICPVDLSDQKPWYKQYRRDTAHCDPSDDEWVYGNDAANLRWGHDSAVSRPWYKGLTYLSDKTADDFENTRDYAYVGVVRTGYKKGSATITEVDEETGKETTKKQTIYPSYGLLKYYNNAGSAPATLTVGTVKCTLAGGPVKSKEGQYYLYYSSNSSTAPYSAPMTGLDVGDDAFINGFNTSFSCSESDRVNNVLPQYSELRMRTDEYKYIHTKYDMEDLPYIEQIYIGVGNTQKEAYADLIGTTAAYGASSVNVNNNSYGGKCIAIGYRRTKTAKSAVHDVFLYSGDNPPETIDINGYATASQKVQDYYHPDTGELMSEEEVELAEAAGIKPVIKTRTEQVCAQEPITYKLLKHNLKKGSDVISLNEGAGGPGLYLYYSNKKDYLYDKALDKQMSPIRNIAFSYGDISPTHISAKELAEVYGETVHGQATFDIDSYKNPSWEYVTGVKGSPKNYKLDGSGSTVMSLNYGQLPKKGNDKRHANDQRVIMYVDHADFNVSGQGTLRYAIRPNASLTGAGYYSATSTVGTLTQKK